MTEKELLKNDKIGKIKINDVNYFYVQDIKEHLPDYKVDVDKIINYEIKVLDGITGEPDELSPFIIPVIRAKDVHPLTKFDKMILKTLKKQ